MSAARGTHPVGAGVPLLGRRVHHPACWWMGMSLIASRHDPSLDGGPPADAGLSQITGWLVMASATDGVLGIGGCLGSGHRSGCVQAWCSHFSVQPRENAVEERVLVRDH